MRHSFVYICGLCGLIFSIGLMGQNKREALPDVSFHHLYVNVGDKEALAQWYVDNIGLEIIDSGEDDVVCVADKDRNFMFKFASTKGLRNTYFDIDLNSFHIAFEGHQTIEQVGEKVLANGGTQVGEIYKNKVGDYVLNLRDPAGFPLQLIHRTDPFYAQPVKSSIRFEHFAFIAEDQKETALWYVQFMNLIIPWSKDIDKANGMYRNYRVPYVGDKENNMSMELFNKDVPAAFQNMSHEVIHLGFRTNDPTALAKQMVFGGASQVGKANVLKNGDLVIHLLDPYHNPIQLIQPKSAY